MPPAMKSKVKLRAKLLQLSDCMRYQERDKEADKSKLTMSTNICETCKQGFKADSNLKEFIDLKPVRT
uniref:C2H2-type domain-containing protein n=1 Tax=Steinernema glaseri TaxID=37863 RepID=A0A1I7Y0R8_9BILA